MASSMRLSVDATGTHLLRDGSFFPLIVDTAWSAFADASLVDWTYYINVRRSQGFTSIAVSVLPIIHDRTLRPGSREPFVVTVDGHYDFDKPNPKYFENAREFARVAAESGIVLSLAVLWCCYVEETWASARTPWAVLDDVQRSKYVSLVTKTFAEFEPIMMISGDEHFHNETPIKVYGEVLKQVAAEAPFALTTMHSTPDTNLPEVIASSPDLDFYVYQSGHDKEKQNLCFDLAKLYLDKSVRRPIVNIEPAYEQHGYGGGAGRFGATDIRQAIWWSILGGASAGMGYGAHGVWQWHRSDGTFNNPGFSLVPFPWQKALSFAGVEDVSFAAQLMVDHSLFQLEPSQDLLMDSTGGVRAASSQDGELVAVYLPYPRDVEIALPRSINRITVWNLAKRVPIIPKIESTGKITKILKIEEPGESIILFHR